MTSRVNHIMDVVCDIALHGQEIVYNSFYSPLFSADSQGVYALYSLQYGIATACGVCE